MKNKPYLFVIILLILIILIGLVFSALYFDPEGTSSYLEEEQIFYYNLSDNTTCTDCTEDDYPLNYVLRNISSYLYPSELSPTFYNNWITLSTHMINISPRYDNHTGKFNLTFEVTKKSGGSGGIGTYYFYINATNDYPNFTHVQSIYNLTEDSNFIEYFNATDEEKHYPLYFTLNFYNNCTHASWWNESGDCNLFTVTNASNISALMNYTPNRNDVGVYYANLTVRDYGANYTCISSYCTSNYTENKTTIYSNIIVFNVFSTLDINSTDCQNRTFQENTISSCIININTKGANDSLELSSIASLRNYQGSIYNSSWFYPTKSNQSNNNSLIINVSFIPEKTEIGNWTINFSVNDFTYNQILSDYIYIYVNRTNNDLPEINNIVNVNSSINSLTRINITVIDDDFLIPDKLEGFNETVNFTTIILNQSNLSEEKSISNFYVQILSMPVNGTNYTTAKIEFTPNVSETGNYFINISIRDRDNSLDSTYFNLSIFDNNAPSWIQPLSSTIIIWENNNTYLNLSENVSDYNDDTIVFSYSIDSSFPSFNMNSSTGVINFTVNDSDIGQHLITINASDGYLINSTVFNLTVYNINDSPYITKPLQSSDIINATVDSNSNINLSEDNLTTIRIWVEDDDFWISYGMRNFYNETLTLNLTIQGPNTHLFNFTVDSSYAPNPSYIGNKSRFRAIFTPNRSDIGSYNITINITDKSNLKDSIKFNLTVLSMEHNPVISNITNQTTAVYRNFNYRINATDLEDGSTLEPEGNTNFTFSYSFINGTDFIRNNESVFNTTSGKFDYTFNSTNGGRYWINITVSDSSGRKDSDNLFIHVYDYPNVTFPLNTTSFNLVEDSSYNLTFRANHSLLNNLTYEFYIEDNDGDNNLRYSANYFGNNTNYTWSFITNLSDETNGIKNLTLVVYPNNELLLNKSDLNTTIRWNLTINNSNSPVESVNTIGGVYKNLSGGSPYQLILSDYFLDLDAISVLHNQTIGFIVSIINTSSGVVTYNVTNWTNGTTPMVYFIASSTSVASYYITAYEYNESNPNQVINNVSSNNFTIQVTVETGGSGVVSTTTGGGGGGSTTTVSGKTPYAFKLITPGKVSVYSYDSISLPISLVNTGSNDFKDIELRVYSYKDGDITKLVRATLDKYKFSSLAPKKYENITLKLFFDGNKSGDYEILINATSNDPLYSDWGKVYINFQKSNDTDLKKFLLFTEEFIVQNPNCLELTEMLKEANELYNTQDYGNARAKAEAVVNKCKEYVEQASLPKLKFPIEFNISEVVIILSVLAFFLGIGYYFFKRIQISRSKDNYTERKVK